MISFSYSAKEQKRRQDILQRIDQQMNMLEEQAITLLSNIDFESMTPKQRVQASSRLLMQITRLLELRYECMLTDDDYRTQIFRNLLLSVANEEGEQILLDLDRFSFHPKPIHTVMNEEGEQILLDNI
jgi:hypothetical protein